MRAFSTSKLIIGIVAVLTVAVCTAQSLPDSFVKDCHALTQTAHRLCGSSEFQQAAEHVGRRLKELQPDSYIEQPFATTQLKILNATLTPENGAPLTLIPMRPNGIIPPVTPQEGISAPIVHVGVGDATAFETVNVEGAIAVLDYNCGQGWVRALRLGAKGVIFTRNENADSRTPHYAESNVNLLRYYYPGDPADLPKSGSVTIHSSVVWEPVIGRNIFAFFKGTDPVFSQSKDEVIIMAANLDSYGEVPTLSPGARGAVNCAALLQIAEHISANRPRRHTLVAFFDNQARGHMGSSMFYRTLEIDKEDVTIAKRDESYANEANFITEMRLLLDKDVPITAASPVRRRLLDRLADKAQRHAHTYKDQEYRLNDEVLTYRKMYPDGFPEKIAARVEEIRSERDKVTPIKHTWNELQRVIGRQKRDLQGNGDSVALSPEVAANLEKILVEVREDIELRAKELEIERLALDADAAIVELIGESWISLHVSLLLGDTSDRWAVIIGGESSMHSWQDNPGLYGKIQAAFLKTNQTLTGLNIPTSFLSESSDQTLPQTRVIWGAPFLIHSGEPAGLFGIYNLALGTVQEATVREGTPNDTLDRLDIARIYSQAADIARFFAPSPGLPPASAEDALGNQPALSLRRGIVASKEYVIPSFDTDNSAKGPMVMGMLQGTSIPNTPMPGAIIQFRLNRNFSLAFNENKPPAFDNFQVLRTNRNGVYSLGPVTNAWGARGGFAAIFDPSGNIVEVSGDTSYTSIRWRLNTFRARSGCVVLPSQQRTDKLPGEDVKILSARANSDLDRAKSFKETVDGVVCWYSEEREKGVKLFSLRQMVGLNNGPQFLDGSPVEDEQIGEGFSMIGAPIAINAAARSSSDLWRLNESRMDILRAKGILDSSLAELHGRSEDILLDAAKPDTSPLRREALTTTSFWASRPVYQKVRAMLDDLVFAVLILLGLSVPFAFALERVIIGATTIYKQIYWFVFFFAVTFAILYLTHPAFAIANTPIIIFLGFAIVVMSTMVIFIIMRKFEYELKAIQGLTATVHVTDVSNVSTFMAAMQMGISTMRRRPTRTALTAITIILLTFTILCFASFGTQSGVVTLFAAPNPSYSGAFVHNVNWNPLSEDLRDIIRGRWPTLTVCRRLWISPKTQDNPGLLISRTDASQPLTIKGVLGVEPYELKQREDLREYFGDLNDNSILITNAVAKVLEVEPGDQVLFRGRRLTVGKLLDAVMLSAAKDMDTSSILPADFTETSSTQPTNVDGEEEMEMLAQKNWASLPVDQVAVVSADTAKTLGASLYGLIIYTEDSSEAIETAENLARILPFPIAATRQNGVYRHLLGTVLKASGAKDLFFPIVLGGLVIFGTMLGSVADRKKEIYTFSALGLAPKHVATLFFAESMVYALIGGLGGYLLAQGTLKLLGVASEYGLVRVPEMNMSSTNTIVTILIVMATVLISSVYPAIRASKSANPGLMRIWRPPEPEGDVMDLVFPFTVSQYDITGVVSFLQEHFGNHTDTGLGRFMTSNVQLVREANGELGLDANLALAPFDLGVSQSFSLRSTPSEIAGIDEVRVVLKRISGQPKDWQRLNKVFLDDLRQQFLIWRSIPRQTMELYRQRTLTSLGAENNQ
ncbi:MAG: FtsX-like permease family protein [Lentisphaerae bacterium]|nr:FtsX-like permease family protein [Lentisphaerota bacterium]